MKIAAKILAVVVIVGLGVAAAVVLVKSRPEPEKAEKVDRGVLVNTGNVEVTQKRIDIEVRGEVQPSESMSLQPQVTGKIRWVSDQLVAGGVVKEGDPLIRIDRADYEIQLAQAQTAVDQARANLELEAGQQKIARREWELFNEGVSKSASDPSLALRKPQQRIAEVNLEAAKARLDKAKLDLRRTTVDAPFNAYVRSENVAVGQQVGPQTQMAQLVGTNAFWIQASIPVDRLSFLAIPGVNTTGEGSRVRIVQHAGDQKIERVGRVKRMLSDLDPAGRMARVIIEVDDPFELEKEGPRGIPMLIGAFVRGFVDGSQERNVAVLPRETVHQGDQVWLYEDGKLAVREVSVVWGSDEVVYVTGLNDGETYVTSRIATPVEGMKLRTEDKDEKVAASAGGDDE